MESNKQAILMRRIAGVLYGVYALYQVFLNIYYLWGAALLYQSVPIAAKFELISALAAALFAVWLLAGDKVLAPVVRRAVVAASSLMVLYQLLTYRLQATLMVEQIEGVAGGLTAIQQYSPDTFYLDMLSFLKEPLWQYVAVIVRLVLIILAAFFVLSSRADEGEKLESEAVESIESAEVTVTEE